MINGGISIVNNHARTRIRSQGFVIKENSKIIEQRIV